MALHLINTLCMFYLHYYYRLADSIPNYAQITNKTQAYHRTDKSNICSSIFKTTVKSTMIGSARHVTGYMHFCGTKILYWKMAILKNSYFCKIVSWKLPLFGFASLTGSFWELYRVVYWKRHCWIIDKL